MSQTLMVLSREHVTISLRTSCDQSIPYIFEVCASIRVIGSEPFCAGFALRYEEKVIVTYPSIPDEHFV